MEQKKRGSRACPPSKATPHTHVQSAHGTSSHEAMPYVKSTLISVLVGEVVTILALLLFSLIMCKADLPLLAMDAFVIAAAGLGGLVAGYLNGRLLRERGLVFGLLCGGVLVAILLLFNALFHQLSSIGFLIAKLGAILACSTLGGILGVNRRQKRVKY